MTDKKYGSITVTKNTLDRLSKIRDELIDEQKAKGVLGAEKIALGDIVETAISFWHVRRKSAEGPVLRSKK